MSAKNKIIAGFLFTFFTLFSLPLNAFALDIPLLTWERGKEQNIVMGGKTGAAKWDLNLVAEGKKPLKFTPSAPNSKGFIVYSLSLPANQDLGAYSVEASSPGNPTSIVAGVRVTERAYYTVTEIPMDLRLLLILYVVFASTFSVIRSRKYANLAFKRDQHLFGDDPFEEDYNEDVEDKKKSQIRPLIQPLYTFRRRRLSALEISFMKFVAMKDGEPLHKLSPNIWAVAPFIGFGLGLFTGLKIQGHTAIPNVATWIIISCAVIGALDAASGIAIGIGLAAVQILFGDLSSIRSMLILFSFTLAWYLPSLLSSMYLLTIPQDFKKLFARAKFKTKTSVSIILSALFGGLSVVLAAILTDSLVINRQGSPLARFPLAVIVFLVLVLKNGSEILIERNRKLRNLDIRQKEESLYLARVVSPSFAFLYSIAAFGLLFIWTQSWARSTIGAALIVAPFVLLFLYFPEFATKRVRQIERNVFVEALFVGLITTGVYFAIQFLPLGVVAKSKAFILFGVVPVLLHGIYSIFMASNEPKPEVSAEIMPGGVE